MKQFQPGQTYSTRSPGDHDFIISVTVERRTAKTIVTTEGNRLHVTPSHDGERETVYPRGRYSLCPVISAA